MNERLAAHRRGLIERWMGEIDSTEPLAPHLRPAWKAGVRWRERASEADPPLFDALRDAIAARDAARERLGTAKTAVADDEQRVASARDAEARKAVEERRAARRARFETGRTHEPGKGILIWPYDSDSKTLGLWVVAVDVDDDERPTISTDRDPSRVPLGLVDSLGLKAPTTADLSRYLDIELIDAVAVEKAVDESPDRPEWYVYDPAKWERKATSAPPPPDRDDATGSAADAVAGAVASGASTTGEFTAALGVSEVTARRMLKDAGLVAVKDGRNTRWRYPDSEDATADVPHSGDSPAGD